MTVTINQNSLAYIDSAIAMAEQFMVEAAEEHQRDFTFQMYRLGWGAIPIFDPFLPFEQARAALYLLRGIERIEQRIYAQKADDFLASETRDALTIEIEKHQYRFRQNLDEKRQQSMGITHYIWVTQGDDKVRDSHARREGQIFRWGEGEMPGMAPNCRCAAAPTLEGATLPNDPPIEAVYPVEELVLIVSGLGRAYRVGKAIYDKLKDTFGQQGKLPQSADRIFQRPRGVPEEWEQTPTKDGEGVIYKDPKESGTYVKVQKGNLTSSQPGQRYDNVRIQKNGQSYDINGNKVPKKSEESHIPLENFKFPEELFR